MALTNFQPLFDGGYINKSQNPTTQNPSRPLPHLYMDQLLLCYFSPICKTKTPNSNMGWKNTEWKMSKQVLVEKHLQKLKHTFKKDCDQLTSVMLTLTSMILTSMLRWLYSYNVTWCTCINNFNQHNNLCSSPQTLQNCFLLIITFIFFFLEGAKQSTHDVLQLLS